MGAENAIVTVAGLITLRDYGGGSIQSNTAISGTLADRQAP